MVELIVVSADITERPCDLLLLKYANAFYGVDLMISKRLGFKDGMPDDDEAVFLTGRNIAAHKVLYVGVGPLEDFRYAQIRAFGRRALELAAHGSGRTRVLCTPIHGPGYGLDEREFFLSLVGGFWDGIESGAFPADLERIEIVELSPKRAERLKKTLSEFISSSPLPEDNPAPTQRMRSFRLAAGPHERLSSFGAQSERKTKLFVAMPFAPEHTTEGHSNPGVPAKKRRLFASAWTNRPMWGTSSGRSYPGSKLRTACWRFSTTLTRMFSSKSGLHWGAGKPTVLIAKNGVALPFDVRGQKCIHYTSIANLRSLLTEELISLKSQGVFDL